VVFIIIPASSPTEPINLKSPVYELFTVFGMKN
jgi:hypothetical protein